LCNIFENLLPNTGCTWTGNECLLFYANSAIFQPISWQGQLNFQ